MFIGIDLGTSGVKALLIDEAQRIVATASSQPIEISRPYRGWSEQDPALWWNAVRDTIDQLAADHPPQVAAVRGIGMSGQMYGAVALDAADRPLRPGILWNDTRSSAECHEMLQREPALVEIARRRAAPGLTAPKLLWLHRHEPELFSKIRTVLLPKDYVRLQLTGNKVSDMNDASGTLWLDVGKREWSDNLLAATHLNRSHMPELVEGTDSSGELRAELAARWGMQVRPVVAGGGGDNACGACGNGVIQPGTGTVSLGTSGTLFVATNEAQTSRNYAIESLCHAVPQVWHQLAIVQSVTSCLNWLAKTVKRPVTELVAGLGDAPRPPSSILFLPFMDGCWSPQDDPDVRAAFIGLDPCADDEALTHAVMQGVAFAMTDAAVAFRENGAHFDELLGLGGGSKSKVWLHMLADSMQVSIGVAEASSLSVAYGAARLALIAATGASVAEVLTRPRISLTVEPDEARSSGYLRAFEHWRALYQPIKAASKGLL